MDLALVSPVAALVRGRAWRATHLFAQQCACVGFSYHYFLLLPGMVMNDQPRSSRCTLSDGKHKDIEKKKIAVWGKAGHELEAPGTTPRTFSTQTNCTSQNFPSLV